MDNDYNHNVLCDVVSHAARDKIVYIMCKLIQYTANQFENGPFGYQLLDWNHFAADLLSPVFRHRHFLSFFLSLFVWKQAT